MFLGSIIGSGLYSAIPDLVEYESVEFSGEINLSNNKLYNNSLTESEIENVGLQVWDVNTIFLANFLDTLEAGNIQNSGLPIDSWVIRRRASDENLNRLIGTVAYDETISEFTDYTPRIGITYSYFVSAKSGEFEGESLEGSGILSTYGWVLTSDYVAPATPTNSYLFDLEIESSDIQNNVDLKIFDTYTAYPSFRQGLRNYRQGDISTVPYNINGNNIEITTTLLNELRSFINDGNIKILRNSAGEIMRVITTDFSYKYFDKISDQPYSCKFKFIEVEDA